MGGGGGNSGSIEYPAYLEDWHQELLYGGTLPTVASGADLHALAFDATNGIFGSANNPYVGVSAYDPDTIITSAQDQLQELEGMVDWLELSSKVPSYHMSSRDLMKIDLAQSYNRIGATYAAANAVVGTSYPASLAIAEGQFQAQVANMAVRVDLEQTRNKIAAVQLRFDHLRTKVAMFMDQTRQDVIYNVEEVMWDVNAYLRLMSAMGAIAGVAAATTKSGDPNRIESVLGSMATGASIGMSGGGPVGAGIGAGIGGILSLFGGN